MAKVGLCALAGALIGAVVVLMVVKIGGPAVVRTSVTVVPQPGTPPTTIDSSFNVDDVLRTLALVLGFCSGAIVGALAGSVGNRAG